MKIKTLSKRNPHNYQTKLFYTYSTLIFIILLILAVLIFTLFYSYNYEKAIDSQNQILEKTSQQLDSVLSSMDKLANGLLFNQDFMNIIRNDTAAQTQYNENNKKILSMIVSLDAPLIETYRVMVSTPQAYYTFVKSGEDQTYIAQALKDYPYQELLDQVKGSKIILPTHPDTFSRKDNPVISVLRNITDYTGRKFGMVEVQNEYEKVEDICKIESSIGTMAVFSETGQIIYPWGAQEGDTGFLSSLYSSVEAREKEAGNYRFDRCEVAYSRSGYSGWTTVIYQPVSRIVSFSNYIFLAIFLTFLAITFVTLILVKKLTVRLTQPLTELNESLHTVSLNNLAVTLSQSYDIAEIDQINDSFQTMFLKLKESIAQTVESRANEERANYLALQSQMNPHTIYNTIAMIESISYMHGDKEISELCVYFSRMLRYISDYTRHHYTVKDEVGHLENYSNLMKKRYEGQLQVTIDADPVLYQKEIPKFTLQPLFENSVKYGFYEADQLLQIGVRIQTLPDGWYILIEDNGSGITPEKIQEIYQQFDHCDKRLKANDEVINMKIGNLALSNIYIRMRILYGEGFSFHIENCPQGGCRIYIEILDTRNT